MEDRTSTSNNSKRQRRELDWRMDPVESRSDFTIEIAAHVEDDNSAPEEKVDTYHVHKNVLEFGTKSSGYFAGLFASATAEAQSNKTRISLHKLAVDAFPVLLDHLYSLDCGVPELTIKNAAPVHHLADYLEVDSLCSKVLLFWRNGIKVEDLGMCLDHANTFRIDALRDIVVRECTNKIMQIELDSHLMEVADAEFWLAVAMMKPKRGSQPHFVSLIAEFCFERKAHLDADTFSKIAARIPVWTLTLDTAMKLLEVEKAVLPRMTAENEPTHLQTRCIAVLASGWKNLMTGSSSQESLQKLSPTLVSRITTASFEHAQEEIQVLRALHGKPSDSHLTSISVTGAGTSAVNGVYSRTAPFDVGDPEYTMNGEWKGQPTIFLLKRGRAVPTKNFFWVISIEREDKQEESIHFFTQLLHSLKTSFVSFPERRVGLR